MSNTVDDLIISLTIKPTSDLGRLQKQLDSLVGKRGRGVGFGLMALNRNVVKLSTDIKTIKYGISKLRPTFLPGKTNIFEQRSTALKLAQDFRDFTDRIIEPFLRTPKGLKEYQEEFGVKTQEEIEERLRFVLDDVVEDLDKIGRGITPKSPEKIVRTIEWATRYIDDLQTDLQRGMEHWRGFIKIRPESFFQDYIGKFFERFSKKELEYQLFPIKPKFWGEKNVKKQLEDLGISTSDIEETLLTRKQKDILESNLKLGESLTDMPKRIDITLSKIMEHESLLRDFPEIYKFLKKLTEGITDPNKRVGIEIRDIARLEEARYLKKRIKGPLERIGLISMQTTKRFRERVGKQFPWLSLPSRTELMGKDPELTEMARSLISEKYSYQLEIAKREKALKSMEKFQTELSKEQMKMFREEIKELSKKQDETIEKLNDLETSGSMFNM